MQTGAREGWAFPSFVRQEASRRRRRAATTVPTRVPSHSWEAKRFGKGNRRRRRATKDIIFTTALVTNQNLTDHLSGDMSLLFKRRVEAVTSAPNEDTDFILSEDQRPSWPTRTVCHSGVTPRCRPCDEAVEDQTDDGCFVTDAKGQEGRAYLSVKPNSNLTEAYYKVPP